MNTPAYHPKAVLKARIEDLEKFNAELLAVCKMIPSYRYCLPKVMVDVAEAAIAKAEGRK